jgi:hypothetical protein
MVPGSGRVIKVLTFAEQDSFADTIAVCPTFFTDVKAKYLLVTFCLYKYSFAGLS